MFCWLVIVLAHTLHLVIEWDLLLIYLLFIFSSLLYYYY